MNQNITSSTRQKIKGLTLYHFRLCSNIGNNFETLMDMFSNKKQDVSSDPNQIGFEIHTNKEQDTSSDPNQIGFEIHTNKEQDTSSDPNQIGFEIHSRTKCLEFLQRHNLINNNKITALGLTVILSHKLDITILSVFILSKLYHYQMTIRKDMAFPQPTLEHWLELFSSASTICRNVYDMKQKQILDDNLRYRLARINIEKLNGLEKYDRYFQQISQYVDDASEKIENLISNDPQIINLRNSNLKLFAGMSFA